MSDSDEFQAISLPSRLSPPPALEQATVAKLQSRGLLSRRRIPHARLLLTAAAVLAAFGVGFRVGQAPRRAAPGQASSTRFVLFLEPLPGETPGAHEPDRVAEYRDWARRVSWSGRAISGEKLRSEVRFVGPGTASPEETLSGRVSGYFVISARDYEDALAVARDCPHVRHGGVIVVRPIDPT